MKRFTIGLLLTMLAVQMLPALADEASEKAAMQAAKSWLGLVDSGKYKDSWNECAPIMKTAISADQWVEQLTTLRGQLGKTVSRKLTKSQYTTSLPKAPKGEYVVMIFSTTFEKRAASTETTVFQKEKDGTWRCSGYYIR